MTNLANAQEHVPESEHNNHVHKGCTCAIYDGIPYKMLTQTVLCYMVRETTANSIISPPKVAAQIISA